jgi:sulfotransferase
MENGVHFISGLPRSGSTLLAALLRQNPRFHASMTSPMASIYTAVQNALSGKSEFHPFVTDKHRTSLLTAVFDAFYESTHTSKVIFDTNRSWCARMPGLVRLFPKAKWICCVRGLPWIIDSFERIVRDNAFEPSRIFNFESATTVYGRTERMMSPSGVIGYAYQALREAFYSEHARRLLLVTYESLANSPASTMASIYAFIEEESFGHNFEEVEYEADEFDYRLGSPGLHRIRTKVAWEERATILPFDIFNRHEQAAFWLDPNQNARGATII